MKTTIFSLLMMSLLVVSVIPGVFATTVGGAVDVDIETEDFSPLVWFCGDRVVYDDGTEPGRTSGDGEELIERLYNYAFEGEQIQWTVLVMDKNGIEKVTDVYATVGDSQGEGNDIESNCQELLGYSEIVEPECNARIGEEDLSGEDLDENTQRYYQCTLTVETAANMAGEWWVTVEAIDMDDLMGTMDENEWWFFNPIIALSIDGDLTFEDVLQGSDSYSSTLLVGNDAEESSGVMLDMFISGTDFYDSSNSGAACPDTNQLSLETFRYFATNGAYSTLDDAEVDSAGTVNRDADDEGYVNIDYGVGFNDPTPFYDDKEIIQAAKVGHYWLANTLSPGSEMAVTFKLSLPEPCNGDFDTGALYFWGEAI